MEWEIEKKIYNTIPNESLLYHYVQVQDIFYSTEMNETFLFGLWLLFYIINFNRNKFISSLVSKTSNEY